MKLVNLRDYGSREKLNEAFGKNWMYIGRVSPQLGLGQSIFANPYSDNRRARAIHVESRDVAIQMYRKHLWQQIKSGNQHIINTLMQFDENTVLVGWCVPKPCHGEVIIKAAKWLQSVRNMRKEN